MSTLDSHLNLHAANAEELVRELCAVDMQLPDRSQGRRIPDGERWTLARVLAAFNQVRRLQFPLSLVHQERPDFLLNCAGTEIGVEVTEAISPGYAACLKLREKEYPGALINMGIFRHGIPVPPIAEIRVMLAAGRLSGAPYAGDQMEQEWAAAIEGAVIAKKAKMVKPGFHLYQQNWLAIHNNLALPTYALDHAVDLLRQRLEPLWSAAPMFDEVLIEHSGVVVSVTRQDAVGFFPIPELC